MASSPKPITLRISGTNSNRLAPTLNVLMYGSVYQGGYIYAVDDTTPCTISIGGKLAALNNQAEPPKKFTNGILWSSNGSSARSYVVILGIDQTSTTSAPSPTLRSYPTGTPPYIACDGNLNDSCDTFNILTYYD